MAKKKKREVVLKSGAVFAVTGETNRHYLCNGTQFRKGNPDITEVREADSEERSEEASGYEE